MTIKRSDSTSSGGLFLSNSNDIKIINLVSKENLGSGVTLTNNSDNNFIIGCQLTNNQRAFGGGVRIDLGSDSNLVQYNTINGPLGSGIYIKGETTSSKNNTLSNNRISQSYDAGIYLNTNVEGTLIENNLIRDVVISDVGGGNGIHLAIGTNNTVVRNNFIYNVQSHGVQLRQEAYKNRIYNNTIYNAGTSGSGSGLYIQAGNGSRPFDNVLFNNVIHTAQTSCITYDEDSSVTSGNQQDYNLCFNPNRNAFKFGGSSYNLLSDYTNLTTFESHGLIADPIFLDHPNNDYRIHSSSPASNSGCQAPCFD